MSSLRDTLEQIKWAEKEEDESLAKAVVFTNLENVKKELQKGANPDALLSHVCGNQILNMLHKENVETIEFQKQYEEIIRRGVFPDDYEIEDDEDELIH